ncbi:hypothetical protein FACS1894137_13310 [Spirochaetia bacterium]|nr:hypothetical protein FACS1894137_13310 [Spirochaetia bacterium]
MKRILLCCEGTADQGGKTYADGEYINADGVMQVFMRRVSGSNDLAFAVKTRQDLKSIRITKKYLCKEGITSLRLALLVKQEKCTHLAYHRDEDKKDFNEMYTQVHNYFTDVKKSGIACLAIVPMRMTESWLLADETAFEKLFSGKPNSPVLPKNPEKTWGESNDDTRPKKYLKNVLAQYHEQPSSELYVQIAEEINIDVLRRKCPISFDQHFYTDMQMFIPKVAV